MRKARPAPRRTTAAAIAGLTLAAAPARAADAPTVALSPAGAVAPFILAADNPSRGRAQHCLAAAVYYEAADQPLAGRQAVAQVVLNRLRHPAYPKSVCGVVFQGAARPGCQFTFACDGSLARAPAPRGWAEAEAVAAAALDGFVADPVSASTHYHALYVRPAWSTRLLPTLRIGAHQFYRFPGSGGEPARLVGAYAGVEPDAGVGILAPSADLSAANRRTVSARFVAVHAPAAAAFTVWGLGVALATPQRNGAVSISWQAPS